MVTRYSDLVVPEVLVCKCLLCVQQVIFYISFYSVKAAVGFGFSKLSVEITGNFQLQTL